MLEPLQWKKVKEIFQAALELPAPEREKFIEENCGGDENLRGEVESLLEAEDKAGTFLFSPALKIANLIPEQQTPSFVGKTIGAYRILEELGRGGMGIVYLAERADEEFEKRVAFKVIKRGLDTDDIVRRFRAERQILANLNHPFITRLIDGGATTDGLPYLVMDYVEGEPLTRFCEKRDFSISQRLELFLQICLAVSYAHQNLIVHRDLKPSNILVNANGVPNLLDFGIAKIISAGDVPADGEQTARTTQAMTPEYASPEQIRGEVVTTATDIYSLGVILYELLTGHRPYNLKNQSLEKIIRTVCISEPVRPSSIINRYAGNLNTERAGNGGRLAKALQGDLDNIVLMALRKEPERRYSSVEQFAEDIRRYLGGLPVSARQDTFTYRAGKFIKRNRAVVAAMSGIAVSLVAGIAATTRQARIAREQRDKAQAEMRKTAQINRFLQEMLASADPRAAGKDAKVTEILTLAAGSIEKDFGTEPEIAADLHSTVGLTYLSLGQLESAKTHLSAALETRIELFGLENAKTALSLNNYGKLLQAQGDLQEAEKMFRRSLAVLRRKQADGGVDAVELAAVLGNLGFLLMLEAQYEEAKRVHREELKIVRERFGENHPETARTLGNLANIYAVTGDKQTAEPLLRDALEITQKYYGDEHPDTALAMLHLAIPLMTYKADEAESLFRRSLALRRKLFGDEHPETAWTLYYLGEALLKKGEYEKAADCAGEVLLRRGRAIPETHSLIHSTLILLGRIHLAANRPAKAEPLLRECLALRRKTLSPEHWLLATSRSILGECLMMLGQYQIAEPLLRDSYNSLKEKFGTQHEQTRLALERYNKFLKQSG